MTGLKMTKQHVQVTIEDVMELGCEEAIVLALLNDRMKSSIRNGFKDENGFFVIYPVKEFKDLLNWSNYKVTKIFKTLKKLGKVETKHTWNKANHIYLPKFTEYFSNTKDSKIESPESRKSESNQINLKHNNKHVDTVNTERPQKSEVVSKTESNFKLSAEDQVNNWVESLVQVAKVSKATANAVVRFYKDEHGYHLDKCKHLMGIVFKTKFGIIHAKDNELVDGSPITKFESNSDMKNGLTATLSRVFERISGAKGAIKNEIGYITNALKNFFLDVLGLKEDIIPQFSGATSELKNDGLGNAYDESSDNQSSPEEIKRVKSKLERLKNRGTVDIKAPAWFKEPYDAEADKISEEDKAEVEALLREFEKSRD